MVGAPDSRCRGREVTCQALAGGMCRVTRPSSCQPLGTLLLRSSTFPSLSPWAPLPETCAYPAATLRQPAWAHVGCVPPACGCLPIPASPGLPTGGSPTGFAMNLPPNSEDQGKRGPELGQLAVSGHQSPQLVAAAGRFAICHHKHSALGCLWGCGSSGGGRKTQRVTLGGTLTGGMEGSRCPQRASWSSAGPRIDDCPLGEPGQQQLGFL